MGLWLFPDGCRAEGCADSTCVPGIGTDRHICAQLLCKAAAQVIKITQAAGEADGAVVKVKAAGGISSLDDAVDFLRLGADRLGTSRVVKIVKNEQGSGY